MSASQTEGARACRGSLLYNASLRLRGASGDTSARAATRTRRGASSTRLAVCGPNTMASTSATDNKTLAANARGARHGDLVFVPRENGSTRRSSACGGVGADSLLY